jgi:hypothetical protein
MVVGRVEFQKIEFCFFQKTKSFSTLIRRSKILFFRRLSLGALGVHCFGFLLWLNLIGSLLDLLKFDLPTPTLYYYFFASRTTFSKNVFKIKISLGQTFSIASPIFWKSFNYREHFPLFGYTQFVKIFLRFEQF